MDLVVHAEHVPAVTSDRSRIEATVRDRVPGARLDEELGVAAEHDLDVADARLLREGTAIKRLALTSAVLPNNSLCA